MPDFILYMFSTKKMLSIQLGIYVTNFLSSPFIYFAFGSLDLDASSDSFVRNSSTLVYWNAGMKYKIITLFIRAAIKLNNLICEVVVL